MNEFDSQPWIAQTKALLDESAEALDAATLSHLNRARQAALAQRRPRMARLWWLPAGLASSCALLLALGVWHPRASLPGPSPLATMVAPGTNGGDVGIVSSDDSLDLYQDLEFYAWLDAQDQDSDG
jgi:hypothetical protein